MKFVMCFSEENKIKMLNNGFSYLHKKEVGDKIVYFFLNDGKMLFDKKEVVYTNVMTF